MPLAPLLFTLTIGALATCTLQVCSQGLLKGYQMLSYPEGIVMQQYRNDTTFFIEELVEEARNLSTQLDLFTDFSGPQINHAKSAFLSFG